MPKQEAAEQRLDELLRGPTSEVRAVLPALLKERDALIARLSELNSKIQAASNLLSVWDTSAVPEPGGMNNSSTSNLVLTGRQRAVRNAVYLHVHGVLATSGKMTQVQLRDEIERKHGVRYSNSGIYRALHMGRKKGYYIGEDGGWRITAKGKTVDPETILGKE